MLLENIDQDPAAVVSEAPVDRNANNGPSLRLQQYSLLRAQRHVNDLLPESMEDDRHTQHRLADGAGSGVSNAEIQRVKREIRQKIDYLNRAVRNMQGGDLLRLGTSQQHQQQHPQQLLHQLQNEAPPAAFYLPAGGDQLEARTSMTTSTGPAVADSSQWNSVDSAASITTDASIEAVAAKQKAASVCPQRRQQQLETSLMTSPCEELFDDDDDEDELADGVVDNDDEDDDASIFGRDNLRGLSCSDVCTDDDNASQRLDSQRLRHQKHCCVSSQTTIAIQLMNQTNESLAAGATAHALPLQPAKLATQSATAAGGSVARQRTVARPPASSSLGSSSMTAQAPIGLAEKEQQQQQQQQQHQQQKLVPQQRPMQFLLSASTWAPGDQKCLEDKGRPLATQPTTKPLPVKQQQPLYCPGQLQRRQPNSHHQNQPSQPQQQQHQQQLRREPSIGNVETPTACVVVVNTTTTASTATTTGTANSQSSSSSSNQALVMPQQQLQQQKPQQQQQLQQPPPPPQQQQQPRKFRSQHLFHQHQLMLSRRSRRPRRDHCQRRSAAYFAGFHLPTDSFSSTDVTAQRDRRKSRVVGSNGGGSKPVRVPRRREHWLRPMTTTAVVPMSATCHWTDDAEVMYSDMLWWSGPSLQPQAVVKSVSTHRAVQLTTEFCESQAPQKGCHNQRGVVKLIPPRRGSKLRNMCHRARVYYHESDGDKGLELEKYRVTDPMITLQHHRTDCCLIERLSVTARLQGFSSSSSERELGIDDGDDLLGGSALMQFFYYPEELGVVSFEAGTKKEIDFAMVQTPEWTVVPHLTHLTRAIQKSAADVQRATYHRVCASSDEDIKTGCNCDYDIDDEEDYDYFDEFCDDCPDDFVSQNSGDDNMYQDEDGCSTSEF